MSTSIVSMASYGILCNYYTIYVDEERVFMQQTAETAWLNQGRFGNFIIEKLFFVNGTYTPYVGDFVAVILLMVSSIFVCMLFEKTLNEKKPKIYHYVFFRLYIVQYHMYVVPYYNKVVGANSRLDEMQAGLLRVRLSHIAELTDERMRLCDRYLEEIHNDSIALPEIQDGATTVWHQFVIRTNRRDELIDYLNKKDIGSIIHYPIPPHLSEAYSYLGMSEGDLPITESCANEVLSIPLYNGMLEEKQDYVIQSINKF